MERRGPTRLAVFVLCAAMAGAGGYGLGRLQLHSAAAPATPADDAVAETTDGSGGPFYVDVGQLMVPVMVDGRTNAFILTQVTVQTGSADQANRIRRLLPHTRNALLQALFGLAGAGTFDGPSVDPAAVARSLKQAATDQLGPALVKAVLIDRLLRQENTRL